MRMPDGRTLRSLAAAPAEPASPRSGEIAASAVVYPGTVIGPGCKIGDGAVVGKQPSLSPRSSTKSEPLQPTVIGKGTIVSDRGDRVRRDTHRRAGDRRRPVVRARAGRGRRRRRGRPRRPDRKRQTIGARTKLQANAYITNYSTIEEDVFIAPGVQTTNDNFMGRTERRLRADARPDDPPRRPRRRRSRAAAGVEIGEEAFVGAGAVVLRDVPARKLVVGNPARVLRDVPEEELLENDE